MKRAMALVALAFAFTAPLALAQSKAPARDQGKKEAKPRPGMPVRAVAARSAPAIDETGAVGTLRADEGVMIRPEIAGRIEKILFEEGQGVKKGALLAVLDASEVRAQRASSAAQAVLDKQRFERAEDLRRKNFISQQALDEAKSNRSRSAAALREVRAKIAKTEIRAPFDGIAGLRQVSVGAFVAAGTDIARLEKLDQLKVDFRVPELHLAKLRTGQTVEIAVDAYPGKRFSGSIYAMEPAVDEQTRTVLVRARIANSELALRPGMFARVQLQFGRRERAVWVPEQAIVPRGEDSYVYRVVGGKAELVKVQTGLRKVGEVEIVKGVAAGDLVITEGTQKIGPGRPVTVMGAPPAPAAGSPGKSE